MMASGTGTLQDPYVVRSWEEFLEYNTEDYLGDYVKFAGSRKYNLARSYPSGVNGGLTIYPNILGNGVSLENLFTRGGQFGIDFKGSIDNLRINAMYVYDLGIDGCGILFEGETITKLTLIMEVLTSANMYAFKHAIGDDTVFEDCQIEAKCVCRSGANRFIYFMGGGQNNKVALNNCDIYLDWTGFYSASFNTPTELNATLFRGYVDSLGYRVGFYDFKQGTEADYPESLIDIKFNATEAYYESYVGDTSAKVYFNADKMPPFNEYSDENQWVGLTTAQITNESALNSAGFRTGGDSPWVFDEASNYIEQEDWSRMARLGAFNNTTQLAHINSEITGVNFAIFPLSTESVGRYSCTVTHLDEAVLPSACTYYNTTFAGKPVSGGTLIE